MMMMTRLLGIFREVLHSPERESDDFEILKITGERLTQKGLDVSLMKPEEVLQEATPLRVPLQDSQGSQAAEHSAKQSPQGARSEAALVPTGTVPSAKQHSSGASGVLKNNKERDERSEWCPLGVDEKAMKKSLPDLVFTMCEQEEILQLLQQWEFQKTAVVNTPRSIFNTYRARMVHILQAEKIPFPRTELVSTGNSRLNLKRPGAVKLWVKRGDVHNTQKGDVSLANKVEEVRRTVHLFKSRGIKQAVLQEHVAGDLIKFYGVGALWFKWFYHKDQKLKRYSFSEATLERHPICGREFRFGNLWRRRDCDSRRKNFSY